jgi:hypothetical protein
MFARLLTADFGRGIVHMCKCDFFYCPECESDNIKENKNENT